MRADARANRANLIATAHGLYVERGERPTYSAIARRAGVGIATLYRHFPQPRDLESAIVTWLRDRIIAVCDRRLPQMEIDPGRAWVHFVADLVDLRLGAVMQLVEAELGGDAVEVGERVQAELFAALSAVVDRAKMAGLVDEQVPALHFQAGLGVLSRPLPPSVEASVPELPGWLVRTFLAGLRPDAQGGAGRL